MGKGKYNTEELFDEYFKTRPETTVKKIRGQLDRKELYEYEEKIGKPLIDMDSLEIAKMLISFHNKSYTSKVYKITFRTYDSMLSIMRDFFDWYIDNKQVIKNPCNDKRIKGRKAIELFSENKEIFTKENMETLIKTIQETQVDEYAIYEEAIIRMFYEGFPEPLDIVNMKENDIDHVKRTVIVRGKERQLSDRLYELLVKVNHMDELPAYRGVFILINYHDSYFKFPTREKFVGEAQDRPPEYWAGHISRLFNREIKVKNETNINARTLYVLGFYDFVVGKIGEDEAKRVITSVRNQNDTRIILELVEEYGFTEKNPTIAKKVLAQFIM